MELRILMVMEDIKVESQVIEDHQEAMDLYLDLVHTARHMLGGSSVFILPKNLNYSRATI